MVKKLTRQWLRLHSERMKGDEVYVRLFAALYNPD
jgi:hypothetical protein